MGSFDTQVKITGALRIRCQRSPYHFHEFFSSSVSVTPGEPLNEEALSTPFTITNTSAFFTLRNIEPGCYIVNEKFKSGFVLGHDEMTHYGGKYPRELAPGGYDTLYCDEHLLRPPSGGTANADVIIEVYHSIISRVGRNCSDSSQEPGTTENWYGSTTALGMSILTSRNNLEWAFPVGVRSLLASRPQVLPHLFRQSVEHRFAQVQLFLCGWFLTNARDGEAI